MNSTLLTSIVESFGHPPPPPPPSSPSVPFPPPSSGIWRSAETTAEFIVGSPPIPIDALTLICQYPALLGEGITQASPLGSICAKILDQLNVHCAVTSSLSRIAIALHVRGRVP